MEFETTKSAEDFLESLEAKYGSKFLAGLFDKIDHYKVLGRQKLHQEGLLTLLPGRERVLKLKFKGKPLIYLCGRFERDVFVARHGIVKDYDGALRGKDVALAITRSR